MSWREKVKKLMIKKGYTQKKLSELSGINEASVSRYLNGEREPRIDVIINFAKALNVTPEYILDEETEKIINPYNEIATVIARNGNNLTPEERNKLIGLILGKED